MNKTTISVIYPTRDRQDFLLRSLAALLDNTVLPDEIIVVDQSRSDSTMKAISSLNEPRIRHIPSSETGVSRARNTGIRASSCSCIGFIDDDCIPAKNWIEAAHKGIDQHANSSVWIGEVYNLIEKISEQAQAASPKRTYSLQGRNNPWRIGPTGGNSFFRKSVFETVGEFDPLLGPGSDFPGAEDGDMLYRVLCAGLRATYTDTIRVFHPDWRSDAEEIRNAQNYGLGVGAMFAKFMANGDLYLITAIFFRTFLPIYLAMPVNLILGRTIRYQINKHWSKSILSGFQGWRAMHNHRTE